MLAKFFSGKKLFKNGVRLKFEVVWYEISIREQPKSVVLQPGGLVEE
jgi:hypothetical protein